MEETAKCLESLYMVLSRFEKNFSEEKKKRGDEIIPLRRMKSPHLWVAELPEGLEVPQTLRVAYKDPMMSFKTRLTINEIR